MSALLRQLHCRSRYFVPIERVGEGPEIAGDVAAQLLRGVTDHMRRHGGFSWPRAIRHDSSYQCVRLTNKGAVASLSALHPCCFPHICANTGENDSAGMDLTTKQAFFAGRQSILHPSVGRLV
jgi:hypothetical protein